MELEGVEFENVAPVKEENGTEPSVSEQEQSQLQVHAPNTTSTSTTTTPLTTKVPVSNGSNGHASSIDEKKLMKKVTWHIMPPILVMYFLCYLDRVNISNVKAPLSKSLHLTDAQFAACVAILFLGYCTFEIPSNLILKSINPATWFSRIMISWGLVSMCQAWVTSYTGLMLCRVFLGVCEAGFFPGIAYYLTLWYTRRERAYSLSYVLAMQCVAGILGGLIAYGVLRLDGRHGVHGWSYLFIIEGAPTILMGFVAWYWVTGSPDLATWLTPEEKEFIKTRVKAPPRKAITCNDVKKGIFDIKIQLFGLMYFLFHNSSYGLSFYNVPIINKFITDPLEANAYSVPLYAVAFVIVIIWSYLADRYKSYAYFIMLSGSMATIGYMLMGVSLSHPSSFGFKYFSMILANAGSLSITPNLVGWMTSNAIGSTETAAGTAFIVSFGNAAGVSAPYILSTQYTQTGSYSSGSYIIMGLIFFGVILTYILHHFYPYEKIVQQAEEEDLRIGYGTTMKNSENHV